MIPTMVVFPEVETLLVALIHFRNLRVHWALPCLLRA